MDILHVLVPEDSIPEPSSEAAETARVEELIQQLSLQPHPEGGYYRRIFESEARIPEGRFMSTAIVFLLPKGAASHWHKGSFLRL